MTRNDEMQDDWADSQAAPTEPTTEKPPASICVFEFAGPGSIVFTPNTRLENVSPMQLWALSEWLKTTAQEMRTAQIMEAQRQAQQQDAQKVSVPRAWPRNLRRN